MLTLALSRLASCVLQSGIDLPFKAIKANIGDSINLLIHIERRQAQRYVAEVLQLNGYSPADDQYTTTPIYQFTHTEESH